MSFSGHRIIFPQYKKALGRNEISGDYNNKISGYYSSDANFLNIFSQISSYYDNLIELAENISHSATITPINTYILDTNITTYNKDTNISSEYSYDEHQNIACSSRIFGDTVYQNCNSWVMKDLDYYKPDPMSTTGLKHWQAEYNFDENYSSAEYRTYSINKTYVEDNVASLTASDLTYQENNLTAMRYILLGCKNNNDKLIPMVYYDLGKTFYSNNNYIEVDWNVEGLITLQ